MLAAERLANDRSSKYAREIVLVSPYCCIAISSVPQLLCDVSPSGHQVCEVWSDAHLASFTSLRLTQKACALLSLGLGAVLE